MLGAENTLMKRTSNGLFVRTPKGQKTPKMLEVERRLGRTLEEDFRDCYVEKGWGQIRLAKKWGVPRNLVFFSSERNGSRSWVEMLNLPVRRGEEQSDSPASEADHRLKCEVCEEHGEHFDEAHWISATAGGGTQSFNILRLCPNCHRKLDRNDPTTTERAKEVLLFREVRRILETGRDSDAKQKELVKVSEAIVTRKVK
jgi:hypothetical protein